MKRIRFILVALAIMIIVSLAGCGKSPDYSELYNDVMALDAAVDRLVAARNGIPVEDISAELPETEKPVLEVAPEEDAEVISLDDGTPDDESIVEDPANGLPVSNTQEVTAETQEVQDVANNTSTNTETKRESSTKSETNVSTTNPAATVAPQVTERPSVTARPSATPAPVAEPTPKPAETSTATPLATTAKPTTTSKPTTTTVPAATTKPAATAAPAPTATPHVHNWVTSTISHDEVGHYVTKQTGTKQVEKTQTIEGEKWISTGWVPGYYQCFGCGAQFPDVDSMIDHDAAVCHAGYHHVSGYDSGYWTEDIQVITYYEDEPVYEDVWVVDTPAWTETVTTCSTCGATK